MVRMWSARPNPVSIETSVKWPTPRQGSHKACSGSERPAPCKYALGPSQSDRSSLSRRPSSFSILQGVTWASPLGAQYPHKRCFPSRSQIDPGGYGRYPRRRPKGETRTEGRRPLPRQKMLPKPPPDRSWAAKAAIKVIPTREAPKLDSVFARRPYPSQTKNGRLPDRCWAARQTGHVATNRRAGRLVAEILRGFRQGARLSRRYPGILAENPGFLKKEYRPGFSIKK